MQHLALRVSSIMNWRKQVFWLFHTSARKATLRCPRPSGHNDPDTTA